VTRNDRQGSAAGNTFIRAMPAGFRATTAVTAAQLRESIARIIAAGHWREGDPDILVVFDAGYDLTRLAWLLRDLPVEVLGLLRSDRVMYLGNTTTGSCPSWTGP
jgi:hypothetical protein